ncbi:unnamed protein product [Schistosoma rodhaini]|uniref:Uncharacterized protein n=1 Tax=Schistosoma mansoni TaxID=6183 RepID=G4V5V4_SCHMA|nr:hypothetical protein Smp_092150 [Schistosoma mansoni]CAH8430680.1 unnamed protein product [Schistosoma rodhaini]|eukprot:XP_018647542.1 hypothetical protein Smp_092150 [Schistosoma mansoni]
MFHPKSSIIISNKFILMIGIVLMFNIEINGLALQNDGLLLKDLKFTRPCPEKNYRFHNATGNFMCVVPTAKKCFELCQQLSCNEWYFMSFVPSGSEEIKKYHRCRCFPEYHMCFYNSVPRRYRDFE